MKSTKSPQGRPRRSLPGPDQRPGQLFGLIGASCDDKLPVGASGGAAKLRIPPTCLAQFAHC